MLIITISFTRVALGDKNNSKVGPGQASTNNKRYRYPRPPPPLLLIYRFFNTVYNAQCSSSEEVN